MYEFAILRPLISGTFPALSNIIRTTCFKQFRKRKGNSKAPKCVLVIPQQEPKWNIKRTSKWGWMTTRINHKFAYWRSPVNEENRAYRTVQEWCQNWEKDIIALIIFIWVQC